MTSSNYILIFAGGILLVVLLGVGLVCYAQLKWVDKYPGAVVPLEIRQLHFAAATLTGLGLIFILSVSAHLWGGDEGKEIFEACKTVIPPIVTLILGYYFGKETQGTGKPKSGSDNQTV